MDGSPAKPLARAAVPGADHAVEHVAVALELNELPGVLIDEPLHTALDRKGLATEGEHLVTIEPQALVPARRVEVGSISSLE